MNLQTPAGPDLAILLARQFALDEIDERVSADPELVAAFWDEVNGSTPPAHADITVLYCFLNFAGATFTLLEFVCGQTLEQLCSDNDPAACERAIPLISRFLDACDAAAMENAVEANRPKRLDADGTIELSDFGIARAVASVREKVYGTVLVRPDGSWPEEILSEGGGRSTAYPLLMAVYKELNGVLPEGTPLTPAHIDSFSRRSLTKPAPPVRTAARAKPYIVASAACLLLLACLFGTGHFLAKRAASRHVSGLGLPPPPVVAPVDPAPASEVETTPAATPAKDTLVVSDAGLTRGPRLIRQIGPEYPKSAREQSISGAVKLDVTIAEDGSVWAATILSGDPILAASAVKAVKKWIYKPALVNGKATSTTTEVEIKFDLSPSN